MADDWADEMGMETDKPALKAMDSRFPQEIADWVRTPDEQNKH